MNNRLKTIVVSIMLTLSLGLVSCETAKKLTQQNTTNNQKQNTNTGTATPGGNTIVNEGDNNTTNETPMQNNIVGDNIPNDNISNTNEQPTKEPQVEENTPIADNTTPQITDTTPGADADNPNLTDNNQTNEQRAPIINNKQTIDNNTGIINNQAEGTTEYQFMAEVEQLIFKKVNEERAKVGVPALTYNTVMEKYARIKSKDMGDRGYFSHNDPEGKLITDRMRSDGVSYNTWGENIAYIGGVSDPTALANQFMTNWMNSKGHRENILSTNFTSIGVGVYKIGNKVYATQEFYR
jgi:uncharacterized protein YkwD